MLHLSIHQLSFLLHFFTSSGLWHINLFPPVSFPSSFTSSFYTRNVCNILVKRPPDRLKDKTELYGISIQSPVLAMFWLMLYPAALTLWRLHRPCSVGETSLHSPKNWNPEIVSCSNKRWLDITVHQNKGDEDVIQVAAVHWQEDEGQPRVTCLLEHL